MGQLESTMETISGASDSVNSSLSERRAQLEGLNGVKSNLAKLQLLMDLPPPAPGLRGGQAIRGGGTPLPSGAEAAQGGGSRGLLR